MTNAEAKEALKNRTPVIYNNIEYLYISAIIYRYDKNRTPVVFKNIEYSCITAIIYRYDNNRNLVISAELTDKNKRSVIIAQLKDVITTYDNQNQATPFLS